MQENQPNTSPDVKTGTENSSESLNKSGQLAGNKAQQDAEEKLPASGKNATGDDNAKEADEVVQGKKLENKNRGGDTQDADESQNP